MQHPDLYPFNGSETDVEISDDVFVLKTEDALKLLEPPRLASLTVRPEHVVVKPGEQVAYTCTALDQYGQPFPGPAMLWSATTGTVTSEGLFTAGPTAGVHTVKAAAGGLEAIVEVRVKSPEAGPDDDKTGEDEAQPGKRIIRWHGTVPPQKWMNFYTKVLTRFASAPGLKLEVSFEVTLDTEQAKAKADETRAGLKELGLSEDMGTG